MIVKKYIGSNETEAVMKAREDLGSSAVVLNVKTMKQRGLARLFKKDYVEITAALEEKEFAQNINSKKPTFDSVANKTVIDVKADEKIVPQSKSTEVIEEKLDNIHKMIRNQMDKEEDKTVHEENVPPKAPAGNANFKSLKLIYNKLLENEVDEKYANAIINDIESSLKKESNLDSILASVYQKIILKLGEPAVIEEGERQKVIFFIGPTGVGKTTTIAKLASEFKLNRGRKIAMITADTYRIAAVEQLNTYASILDVSVNVVYTPAEIVDNVRELSSYDMIFVDTAGRSHKNQEQRDEIIEMIELLNNSGLNVDTEVFLVLSVTTKYKDLVAIANAYSRLENIKLLFTKIDETVALGNILNMRWYTDAPLSYSTYGQNVPDDIEKIDVQKLAKHLLGGNN
ncbi:MAG: flagellar biosynthesis protein FlhF [Butyrivibrio sp.]